ncbi:hypothetical protein N7539_007021 [Penicillium diatomitis]|uniref:RNB domain-containing protein n=1 Tax=Penicillium diatomitis TaxID=2819901 RepID=A0A9W9X2T6_9EURO|nr:uncharacterized protein N7539_007021 [Penicillium diatomitis]KAJ5481127.1 hypothetical protein N7539_007021 [Penicillium diatomitis]
MVLTRVRLVPNLTKLRYHYLKCFALQQGGSGLSTRLPTITLLSGSQPLSTSRALKLVGGEQVEDGETENAQVLQNAPITVENARLQAELETYRDIREYLRKWNETNPSVLDPVREPGSASAYEDPGQLVGNMLNGREASDALWASSELSNKDDFDTSQDFEGDHLEPGDLVARLTCDGIFSFAIYVQSVHKQKQVYTNRGNWRICSNREIDYVVKGFALPSLLDPIKPYFPNRPPKALSEIQSVPEGGLPRPLGRPLIEMMIDFEQQVSEFYREHSQLLDNIHDMVADDSDFLRLTLEELAMKLLNVDESELNRVNLFAVHQAVRRRPFAIDKDFNSLFQPVYLIQPKRITNTVRQVTTWVHEHQEYLVRAAMVKDTTGLKDHPMQQFVQKAQRLIRLSRKVRSPTVMSSVGPSSQKFHPGQDGKPLVYREVLTEKFSKTDQTIIEYMQLYAIPSVAMPSGTLRSIASHVMRATGMYNTLGLSESSTRMFLQELGVISPWENLSLLDQNVLLPGHGMSLMEDMKWEELEETCAALPGSMTDSMKDLRRDWGDLPVYCIDAVTAQEIDDGVSLERIPGSDDTFWVRIHVANPTAFFKHDNPLMEYAKSRLATTYAPERTYPIFPKSFTQTHFSLSDGRPTLTFSAKMNVQGEILDTEIINGTIRNVVSLTHTTLQQFLDPGTKISSERLTVGGEPVEQGLPEGKAMRDNLTADDKDTFSILRQLMLGFRTQRQKNGAMDIQPPRPDTSLSVYLGTTPAKPYDIQVNEGRYFLGDPIIQLQMSVFDPHEVRDESKRYLVSLLMNLAGHIAGQFCAARNIPVIYNGTWYDPECEHVTRENMDKYGGEAFYQLALPKAVSASVPLRHHMLGLDAYVKSTSPLRRFSDVIAHYQIEAVLRYEHEHGRQFDATVDTSKSELDENGSGSSTPAASVLPYSQLQVDDHIEYSAPILARLRAISTYSNQHWACMLLFRAFYFAECALPESFPVILRSMRVGNEVEGTTYSGIITNLGVNCTITIPDTCPDKDKMDVFGVVDAQIKAVDMANLEVKMEATRLIKSFGRTGEWA